MKNFDTRVYSISDFLEWESNEMLVLSPEFQRRSVWTVQAKSYLLDTIVTGKPMPKILMTQNLQGTRHSRVIIDGQQRLRAIIDYCNDQFSISKTHNKEFGGKYFSNLPEDVRNDVYKYELGVDVLFGISYEETLDIFARLNTYSVRLNKQELFNANYLGPFKQNVYQIGYEYVKYWLDNNVLTSQKVARMGEAELASDLLVVAVDGIQSNKQIEKYYKLFEDDESLKASFPKRVRQTINIIQDIYPNQDLKQSNYRRIHLFYSLYCAIYHSLFGIKNFTAPKVSDLKKKTRKARIVLDDLSAKYDNEHKSLEEFIDASRRGTTDPRRRQYRAEVICKYLAKV